MDNIYSDFAYDDAFRTMESECDDILISFVNYFHNEDYDRSAKVIRGRNEHFIEHEDHSEDKRITDSSFTIEANNRSKNYHYECESGKYDDSLLIRMFEYDAQIALDRAEVCEQRLRVEFPYSGLLLLRGSDGFDKAVIEIVTSGGSVEYPVVVRHMSGLTIDEIFRKHLYMLLPFYVFNLEKGLDTIEADSGELEDFVELYRNIADRLESDLAKGYLSQFSHGVIISLIHKVMYKMNVKRSNIRERIGDIMGGKVLELDIIKARHEGLAIGEARGEARGRANERENLIKKLAASYMKQDSSLTEEEAMEMARTILE